MSSLIVVVYTFLEVGKDNETNKHDNSDTDIQIQHWQAQQDENKSQGSWTDKSRQTGSDKGRITTLRIEQA